MAETASDSPLTPTLKAIIGEAAGEGQEGMRRVARVIATRAALRRLTSDQVVQQPHQFSAMARPDLETFVAKQGPEIRAQAQQAWQQGQQDVAQQGPWATHYVTAYLMSSPTRPSWVDKMQVVERHGGHVFLKEKGR